MESKRIFVAIKITNTIQIQEIFRQVGIDLNEENIKWAREDGLHITLLFIGNKRLEEFPELIDNLRVVCNRFSSFPMNLKGMGTFPSVKSPRVLWIGVNANQFLFDLQKEIRNSLQEEGVEDAYKYTPHLTIGRIKGGVKNPEKVECAINRWKEWDGGTLEIKEFVLMESILSEKGPRYSTLETFAFNL